MYGVLRWYLKNALLFLWHGIGTALYVVSPWWYANVVPLFFFCEIFSGATGVNLGTGVSREGLDAYKNKYYACGRKPVNKYTNRATNGSVFPKGI